MEALHELVNMGAPAAFAVAALAAAVSVPVVIRIAVGASARKLAEMERRIRDNEGQLMRLERLSHEDN